MNRSLIFIAGVASIIAFAGLWHGPLGAGERLATRAEKIARKTLDYYELPAISARVARDPLKRTLLLSGPADSFQRSELIRIMAQVPGINEAGWKPAVPPVASRQ